LRAFRCQLVGHGIDIENYRQPGADRRIRSRLGLHVLPQQADVTFAGREALVPLFLLKASGRWPDVAGEDLDVEVVEQLPNFITRVRHVLISRINTI